MVADGHSLSGLAADAIINPYGRYLVGSHLKRRKVSDDHIVAAAHRLSCTDNHILIADDILVEFCIDVVLAFVFQRITHNIPCTENRIVVACHLGQTMESIIFIIGSQYRITIAVDFQVVPRHFGQLMLTLFVVGSKHCIACTVYFNVLTGNDTVISHNTVSIYLTDFQCIFQCIIVADYGAVYDFRGRTDADDHAVGRLGAIAVIVGARRFLITGYRDVRCAIGRIHAERDRRRHQRREKSRRDASPQSFARRIFRARLHRFAPDDFLNFIHFLLSFAKSQYR